MARTWNGVFVLDEKDQAKLCLVCGKETRKSKPYCPEHVDRMPYIQDLNQRIKDYDPKQDILQFLEDRHVATDGRIRLELCLSKEEVSKYLKQLKRAGLVKMAFNTRHGLWNIWLTKNSEN